MFKVSRMYLYDLLRDVAYDFIPCDGVEGDFDVLYFGTLALRGEENFRSLRRLVRTHSFGEIFSDVNIRPPFYSRETVRFSVETATVLKMSLEELPAVADALGIHDFEDHKCFAHALARANSNLKCILITLGEEGAYALDCRTGAEAFCGARTVPVVSTVGAGDSFPRRFSISTCARRSYKLVWNTPHGSRDSSCLGLTRFPITVRRISVNCFVKI